MRTLTIRESAIDACNEAACGDALLLAICKEAFSGKSLDWDNADEAKFLQHLKPLYKSIAPDIIASVREEEAPSEAKRTVVTRRFIDPE